jgi:hypothetical protein
MVVTKKKKTHFLHTKLWGGECQCCSLEPEPESLTRTSPGTRKGGAQHSTAQPEPVGDAQDPHNPAHNPYMQNWHE